MDVFHLILPEGLGLLDVIVIPGCKGAEACYSTYSRSISS